MNVNGKIVGFYTFCVVILTAWLMWHLAGHYAVKTETVIQRDTVYTEKTDTVPPKISERIITRTITKKQPDGLKMPKNDTSNTAVSDSLRLDVVQRVYSDDSTYTAYVSGAAIDDWPKLDSIRVRQRTITNNIIRNNTITKKPLITFGLQVGAGYGIVSRKPDIYIGIGGQINL